MTTNSSFADWLNHLLAERNMRPADLVRLSGLDKSAVSRILSGNRSPEPETIKALAHALRIPPEIVFRVSIGLSSQSQQVDENHERANQLMSILKSESSKKRAVDYLELLIQQEEREAQESAAKARKNHPATQPR